MLTTQNTMRPVCTVIEILKVNPVRAGLTKLDQKPYEWHTAKCLLLNDTGEVVSVCQLVFPKELRETMGGVPPIGTYQAVISLTRSTSENLAGEIVPQITQLIPSTVRRKSP